MRNFIEYNIFFYWRQNSKRKFPYPTNRLGIMFPIQTIQLSGEKTMQKMILAYSHFLIKK